MQDDLKTFSRFVVLLGPFGPEPAGARDGCLARRLLIPRGKRASNGFGDKQGKGESHADDF